MKNLKSIFSLTVVLALAITLGARISAEAKGVAGARYTKLAAAVSALEEAKEFMLNSPASFNGQKDVTIQECDKAVAQLKKALE